MSFGWGVKPTYSSDFSHNKNKKSKGFTLAEVLITLGIIGVVAAITMPTLINNYREKATVNKVKKFYSMISQAYLLSVKDNGHADSWDISSSTQLASYFKPYLKIQKDCNTTSGCLGYTEPVKKLNNTDFDNYDISSSFYKMILMDNSVLLIRRLDENCNSSAGSYVNIVCGEIFYDINGSKTPNILGKDVFVFLLLSEGVRTYNYNDCTKSLNGWGCTKYIITNSNMNYLH